MKTTYFSSLLYRYKLIRRRVVWLIGQWIPVKFKSDLRPVLYEIILSLMQDPDLVVGGNKHKVGVSFFFSSFSKKRRLFNDCKGPKSVVQTKHESDGVMLPTLET